MSKRTRFFKAKPKRGLRRGSFTPLQVERSKSSSALSGGKVAKCKLAAGIATSKKIPEAIGHQFALMSFDQTNVTSVHQNSKKKLDCTKTDLKSHLPVSREPTIIAETQSSDDCIDSSQEEKQSNKFLEEGRLIVDLKSHSLANKEPIIIPETQYSDKTTGFSQKKEKLNNILEDRSCMESLIKMQNKIVIETENDLESDFQTSDVIHCTYVIKKKECNVADQANKVLEEIKDLKAAEFKINKSQIVKSTVLTHANTNILYENDESLKNNIIMKLNESKYKPEKKEERKLAGLYVKMRHQVLPQHKIERAAGTRTMNSDERARFEKYIELRNGPFQKSEDDQIKENWKTFCQDNDWDPNKPEPFLLMKHNGNKKFLMYSLENRLNFVRCLAHGLPDRCLYSVNYRFRNLFSKSSNKTDKYTEAEDRKIRQYLSLYPHLKTASERDHQYADLATILNRTRNSVWRRVRLLKKKAEGTGISSSPARGSGDASSCLP